MATLTLESLAEKLMEARIRETEAKENRINVEEEVIMAIIADTDVDLPDVGSKSVKAGSFKFTVKKGMKYKPDMDEILSLAGSLPDECLPVKATDPVPAGYVFDAKKYEALRESNPKAFASVSEFVLAEPTKPAVTVRV